MFFEWFWIALHIEGKHKSQKTEDLGKLFFLQDTYLQHKIKCQEIQLDVKEIDEMIATVDKNEDWKISYSEFRVRFCGRQIREVVKKKHGYF